MKKKAYLTMVFLVIFGHSALANPEIRYDVIRKIESSGCKFKVGRFEDARGCYQVTKDALADWNMYHKKEQYTMDDMWDDALNKKVAHWYLNKRIPQMIRYFKREVTLRNILIAYNAGIKYVKTGEEIPAKTKSYLEKYKRYSND